MFRRLFSRRGGAAVAVVALSVSGITTAAAGTAGATDNQTTVISGSGSNTIYQLDVELADLFNLAPGCNLSGGTPQPLNFACSTAYETSGTVNQPGENGEPATEENPNNDVVFNYPALGSGNGVNQLNGVNSGAEPDINFARSSATPANSNGTSAQNYVQFAIDGVSWVDFPSKDTKKITNLTVAQLQAIYADTPGYCTVKRTVYPADNWICYGAKTSLPNRDPVHRALGRRSSRAGVAPRLASATRPTEPRPATMAYSRTRSAQSWTRAPSTTTTTSTMPSTSSRQGSTTPSAR